MNVWATEMEIIAAGSMLSTTIYTIWGHLQMAKTLSKGGIKLNG